MATPQRHTEDWAASSFFLGKVSGAIGSLLLGCFLLAGVLDPVSFERFVLETVFQLGLLPLFVAAVAGLVCAIKASFSQGSRRFLGLSLVLNGGGLVVALALLPTVFQQLF